jgi:hypothetical protein
MASDLINLRAHAHSAELHRRAELHRLAAGGRASKPEARPTTRSLLHLGSPAEAVRWTVARVSAAVAALR